MTTSEREFAIIEVNALRSKMGCYSGDAKKAVSEYITELIEEYKIDYSELP